MRRVICQQQRVLWRAKDHVSRVKRAKLWHDLARYAFRHLAPMNLQREALDFLNAFDVPAQYNTAFEETHDMVMKILRANVRKICESTQENLNWLMQQQSFGDMIDIIEVSMDKNFAASLRHVWAAIKDIAVIYGTYASLVCFTIDINSIDEPMTTPDVSLMRKALNDKLAEQRASDEADVLRMIQNIPEEEDGDDALNLLLSNEIIEGEHSESDNDQEMLQAKDSDMPASFLQMKQSQITPT